jgi:RNase P/RNase MRP subunit POP5
VKSLPPVQDPREMMTILTFSLRDLYGEFESYSIGIEIVKEQETLIVKCPVQSAKQIRAALTLVTPPLYLEPNHYRFDVVEVETI